MPILMAWAFLSGQLAGDFSSFSAGILEMCIPAEGKKQGWHMSRKTKVGHIFREIKAGFFRADYKPDFKGLYIGAVQGAYIRGIYGLI